jgi:hypothetical protein
MNKRKGSRKEESAGIPDEISAVRATLIGIFREAIRTGSDLEVDFIDHREASTEDGGYVLSQVAIRLLIGDDVNEGDVDACRQAVRRLQGRTNAAQRR